MYKKTRNQNHKNMEENSLHLFLAEKGIPIDALPKLVSVQKSDLVRLVDGYNNEKRTKVFYICVCNSGHDICCSDWDWVFSGWSIRVVGKQVLFFKGAWKFSISQIPVFQDLLFVVSQRTKVNELAQDRKDIVCFSHNRKKLLRKTKSSETKRKGRSY